MGNRANFGFTAAKGKPTLFLYGHYAGLEAFIAKFSKTPVLV